MNIDLPFTTLFVLLFVLVVCAVFLRSITLPKNFFENQLQRNEARKQLIKNRIIEEEVIAVKSVDQVS